MSKHRERTVAQPECIVAISRWGWGEKHRDGVSGLCGRCNSKVTLLSHTDKGVADYIGLVRHRQGPISVAVEVKDGGNRLPFGDIEADQWTWLADWEKKSGGVAWFWILMGTGSVVAPDESKRRRTFLVPRAELADVFAQLAARGSKSIPLVSEHAMKKEGHLWFTHPDVLGKYGLQWMGRKLWWPGREHPFWEVYRQPYYHPASSILISEN